MISNNERLKILFKNQYLSMGGSSIPTFIVFYLLLKEEPYYLMLSFLMILVSYIPRVLIVKKYQKTKNPKLEKNLLFWVLLSSIIISIVTVFAYPKDDLVLVSLLAAYYAGMTAGAITTLGSSLKIYKSYAIPQLVTLILCLVYFGQSERSYLLALSVTVYLFIMLKVAKHSYSNIIKRFSLEEKLYDNLRYKSVDNMLDVISHKVNNPLNIAFVCLNFFKEDTNKNDKERYLNYLEESLKRIESIGNIHEELKYKNVKPNSEKINTILNEIGKEYPELIVLKSLKNYEIEVDKNVLKESIAILVKNSKESKSNLISLSCEVDEDKLVLIFKDDGEGIDKKHIHNIFLPFYSTKSLDRGLGLNFAKKYIELMEGEINLKKDEDKGATFLISLKLSNKNDIIKS